MKNGPLEVQRRPHFASSICCYRTRRIIAFHSCSGGIGLAAARAVLDGAGVDYEAAFYASWKPEYIDDMGQGEMSAREWELNEVWWKAHQAAFDVVEG